MMIFGGSPHIVADPPRFAQNTSARTIGTGLNFRSWLSSTVTAARNRITVIESMNIARIPDISMKVTKIGITLYLTVLARSMHSHLKNPTRAIPSTIIIIPEMKMIVAQLIPLDSPSPPSAAYQNPSVKMFSTLSVLRAASAECMPRPNTRISVRAPHTRVVHCRSNISRMMRMNITTKMETDKICANNMPKILAFRKNNFN